MSGAGQPPGLQVGSTKPQSREERRAAAARVRADDDAAPATAAPDPGPPPTSPQLPAPASPPPAEPADQGPQQPPLQLRARKRNAKRPFATQLRGETIARLDWIRAQGYVLTDTVDDAINDYLDRAGVPRIEEG